jgi:hypothetical protein
MGVRGGTESGTRGADTILLNGFAAIQHESACDLGEGLDTTEGTDAYLAETIARAPPLPPLPVSSDPLIAPRRLLKKELGASEVIPWISVVRKNHPDAGELSLRRGVAKGHLNSEGAAKRPSQFRSLTSPSVYRAGGR